MIWIPLDILHDAHHRFVDFEIVGRAELDGFPAAGFPLIEGAVDLLSSLIRG
jgi:hypothetical protein